MHGIWKGMRGRCQNQNLSDYPNYGARGIRVCPEWDEFMGFWSDMGPSYFEGATIDRLDVNGNYCKENCRWIPKAEQSRNRRNVKLYQFEGAMHTIPEIARKVGMRPGKLFARLKIHKMPLALAVQPRHIRRWGKKPSVSPSPYRP